MPKYVQIRIDVYSRLKDIWVLGNDARNLINELQDKSGIKHQVHRNLFASLTPIASIELMPPYSNKIDDSITKL